MSLHTTAGLLKMSSYTEEGVECIAYKSGYKYQLKKEYVTETGLEPGRDILTPYIAMTADGRLTIRESYAWDGPSGPTFDTLNFMRGSLVHDALYQLMREGELQTAKFKDPADRLLQKMCKEDGMSTLRAWYVYQGVRLGGNPATDPANERPLTGAPKGCPGIL